MVDLTLQLDYNSKEDLINGFLWKKFLSTAIECGKCISFAISPAYKLDNPNAHPKQLHELAFCLRSITGAVQLCAVYDISEGKDLADGCSVDYAVKNYANYYLDRITAYGDYLVLHVHP